MRIFVLEDDFSQQTRIETTIEKLLKEHHITPNVIKLRNSNTILYLGFFFM